MGRGPSVKRTVQFGVTYLSVEGAMQETGTSRRTIYNWMDEGKIRFAKAPGGKRWIVADSLAFKAVEKDKS